MGAAKVVIAGVVMPFMTSNATAGEAEEELARVPVERVLRHLRVDCVPPPSMGPQNWVRAAEARAYGLAHPAVSAEQEFVEAEPPDDYGTIDVDGDYKPPDGGGHSPSPADEAADGLTAWGVSDRNELCRL